ncbi:MAG TPA: glycosyltransferase family 2 protein [Candidatus Eisenbacteria bacterium]|nr:glycosyltransferase family 2 protein [Candidatus Eisenbacteria bacterium]
MIPEENFTQMIARLDRETGEESRAWLRENRAPGPFRGFFRGVRRFASVYRSERGSRAGVRGLFFAVNEGMRPFLSAAKCWEAKLPARRIPMGDEPPRGAAAPPAAGRETLAAVVMTKDCEDLVEGTLRSVAGWADEIVVIDGFSKDRTVEICRKYTDKVFQNKWDGYRFCTERNLGNAKASADWCFHVDPDERATPEFRRAVTRLLESKPGENAFEFRKKNFFLGRWMRHGGWFHYSRHLFRRGKATYDGVIHESLKVDGGVGKLEAPVEHYPFVSISQFVERHNGYSKREALALKESHGSISERETLFNLKSKPVKRFFKFYFKKKGFLEGAHGLVFSTLFAWVHFVNWAKYWELGAGDTRA